MSSTADKTIIEEKKRVLRAIWRDKMHVEPTALELSPPDVRSRFAHIWEPSRVLSSDLEAFPLGLLRTWQRSTRGHLIFTHRATRYQPTTYLWHGQTIEGVCFLSLSDLGANRKRALLALINLFDHLLGSDAREGQPWLSDGAGINQALREVSRRFAEVYALGYGKRELEGGTAHDYLAQTLWAYLHDPRRLNVLDPLVYRLYQHTLMSEDFWLRMQKPQDA